MPKASYQDAQKLGIKSPDCSFLLTHLIRQNDEKSDKEALNILKSILNLDNLNAKPILKVSEMSWFNSNQKKIFNPSTKKFESLPSVKAISFTESTLMGLKAHSEIFKAKFGIAFSRKRLEASGANPCLNVREDILNLQVSTLTDPDNKLFNYIPAALTPFINVINFDFDATHEREWRMTKDFEFSYQDIVFIFCPFPYFKEFASIQKNGKPILFDLNYLERI